jgi:tripartite-type tricarboxylate transporter receptor subunit TctC
MRLIKSFVVISCILLFGGNVAAQSIANYPDRTVTIIVGFPPGTATDTVARVLAERFTNKFGKTFIVDNKAGQGGSMGSAFVAKAAPDGYTLVLSATAPLAINPNLYTNLTYDPRKNFAPIGLVSWLPYVFVTNPKTGINTIQQLTEKAKANPGQLTYASIGNGSTSHLLMSMLTRQAGINITHIPYKGSAQSQTDVIAGQVDMTFDTMLTLMPHIKAGKLKAVATGGLTRSQFAQDVPTLDEQGLTGFNGGAWLGLLAPAGTPKPIIDKLHKELNAILDDPDVIKRLNELGSESLKSNSPAEFSAFIQTEYTKWGQRVRDSGAKIE